MSPGISRPPTRGGGQTRSEPVKHDVVISDPLGLYAGRENPFQVRADAEAQQQRAADEQAQADAERQRAEVEITAANDETGRQAELLEAGNPGRYQLIDESEIPVWQQQWEAENRSGGIVGDTGRILESGNAGVGLAVREAVGMIHLLAEGDGGSKALRKPILVFVLALELAAGRAEPEIGHTDARGEVDAEIVTRRAVENHAA